MRGKGQTVITRNSEREAVHDSGLSWMELEEILESPDLTQDQQKWLKAEMVAQWVMAMARWDVFFTGTFETSWCERHAAKAFERWVKQQLRSKPAFYVVEQHPGGHGAHVHALLASSGAYRTFLWRTWFERYGRARAEPVRQRRAVVAYCYKYVLGREMTKQWKQGVWWNVLHCHRREMLPGLRPSIRDTPPGSRG